MSEPVLAILAAGMGSRYGGLKQIDVVGNNGESIIDFSIYDAYQAGFKKVILIIREEHEAAFEAALGHKVRNFMEVKYAYQKLDDLPGNLEVDKERTKPWGTTQALLTLKDLVGGPFMIINADDYYGKTSFKMMYDFLKNDVVDYHYGMVAYTLAKTLSKEGSVTRAICERDGEYLTQIKEIPEIILDGEIVKARQSDGPLQELAADLPTSMNYWGFNASVFPLMEKVFYDFLLEANKSNPLTSEHVIATAIGELLKDNLLQVKVLTSKEKWFGVTYQSDKENVTKQLANYKAEGIYPFDLWQK